MHAENVLRCADGAPFALLGISAGGWIAHAVTSHLESLNIFPTALVLIDAYLPHYISARIASVFQLSTIATQRGILTKSA
jgi:thioesterase domain-containing protein